MSVGEGLHCFAVTINVDRDDFVNLCSRVVRVTQQRESFSLLVKCPSAHIDHRERIQAGTSLICFPDRLIFNVLRREESGLLSLECASLEIVESQMSPHFMSISFSSLTLFTFLFISLILAEVEDEYVLGRWTIGNCPIRTPWLDSTDIPLRTTTLRGTKCSQRDHHSQGSPACAGFVWHQGYSLLP